MTDERTNEARQTLDELASILGTLSKMARDIEPSLCADGDISRLYQVQSYLEQAEDKLADICADNNEAQEMDDD